LAQLPQNSPIINDFSLNALAFNCGLITFEKFDIGRMHAAWFFWQLENLGLHAEARIQEANTRTKAAIG